MTDVAELATSRSEYNKQLVRRYQEECMHRQNWDNAAEYLAEDLVIHIPEGVVPAGRDNALTWFRECASWFTSLGIEIKFAVADDDTVFQLQELHFEHTGDFMGIPPTGKRFSIAGLAAFKIRDGRIAEHWGLYDMDGIPAKLGVELAALK